MKRIVIFGATGDLGTYFVDWCCSRLDRSQFELIAVGTRETDFFDSMGVPYRRVDVRRQEDFSVLPLEDVYAVVHMAGLLPAYFRDNDPLGYADVNVMGSLRVLEYARSVGADRLLYTQTWAELAGYWNTETVLSPDMPRKLLYTGDHAFYAIGKSMIVDTLEYYWQEFGLKRFVFRLPNIYLYSPEKVYYVDGKERRIADRYMIDRAIRGDDIELWGDPDAFKDVVYVKDLCQMMYKALLAEVDGGIYHAGTGVRTTLREQIEGMVEVFSPPERPSRIVPCPEKPGFVSFVMDIENARRELGYVPQYGYLDYLKDYKKEMELKRFDALRRR